MDYFPSCLLRRSSSSIQGVLVVEVLPSRGNSLDWLCVGEWGLCAKTATLAACDSLIMPRNSPVGGGSLVPAIEGPGRTANSQGASATEANVDGLQRSYRLDSSGAR